MNSIIHGLDSPDDISEQNNKIIMEQLGISEKYIEDDSNEYICDDRNQLEEAEMIRNMTDEEWDEYIKAYKEKEQLNEFTTIVEDLTLEERIKNAKELLGLDSQQSFQDIEVKEEDEPINEC